jgi:hypothetical protein
MEKKEKGFKQSAKHLRDIFTFERQKRPATPREMEQAVEA